MSKTELTGLFGDRINQMHAGVFRILLLVSSVPAAIMVALQLLFALILVVLYVMGFISPEFRDTANVTSQNFFLAVGAALASMIATVVAYALFWVAVRAVLWVGDGFSK